jgi:hypothetical protein
MALITKEFEPKITPLHLKNKKRQKSVSHLCHPCSDGTRISTDETRIVAPRPFFQKKISPCLVFSPSAAGMLIQGMDDTPFVFSFCHSRRESVRSTRRTERDTPP